MRKKILIYITLIISILSINMIVPVATKAESDSRSIPIIMYHSVLKSKCGQYIINPNSIEEDIINLKAKGYESVFISQVIDFVNGKGTLPPKPVVITFDDGHYNNLVYALPLFEKYDFKGIVNVIGAFSDYSFKSGDHSNANYSHLTWEQISQLDNSKHFEIGNHTYNMHKYSPRMGILRTSSETVNEYRKNLSADVCKLQNILKEKCNIEPTIFAYPFGRYSQISEQVIREMGFKAILTCSEQPNLIKVGDTEKLFKLNRYNRDGRVSSTSFIEKICK